MGRVIESNLDRLAGGRFNDNPDTAPAKTAVAARSS